MITKMLKTNIVKLGEYSILILNIGMQEEYREQIVIFFPVLTKYIIAIMFISRDRFIQKDQAPRSYMSKADKFLLEELLTDNIQS